MTLRPEPTAAKLVQAVRELLAGLMRARHEVGRFPGEPRLREAGIAALDKIAQDLPQDRPCVLQLEGRLVRCGDEVVLREPLAQPLFRTLSEAGVTGILLAPPLTGLELLRFVELVLDVITSEDAQARDDVVERLRAGGLLGMALIFTPIEGATTRERAASAKKGLAEGTHLAMRPSDARRLRSALERDFGRNMPLAAASAVLDGLGSGHTEGSASAAVLLERLMGRLIGDHRVHAILALLEESDRCEALEEVTRTTLTRQVVMAADDTWIGTVLTNPTREQAFALGVLVLRCQQLLPGVLTCFGTTSDPVVAHELELIARLNPEPFATCAASTDARLAAPARMLLARAGHELGTGPS